MLDASDITLRAPAAGDAAAARALLATAVEGTPYDERLRQLLGDALEARGDETLALVAAQGASEPPELAGVAVYGLVAGTAGAGKLHFIAVTAGARLQGIASRLLDAVAADLAARGARFILAEVPDDPRLAPGRELLVRCAFAEEARIADFVADGIALLFLRRDLGAREP